MADVIYIPFQRVKDWKAGDRIIVDGNPGKIRDIAEFENPSGSGETIASIGVEYDFSPYSEEEVLNWDVAIEVPPPRPSGTIRARLKYKGRSKPMPIENPWA